MGTKVYKFWCEPAAREDHDVLREQLRLNAEYRRLLVIIENASHDHRDELDQTDAEVRALVAEQDRLLAASIRDKDALAAMKKLLAAARKRWHAADDYRASMTEHKTERLTAEGDARKTVGPRGLGLGFGTYLASAESHAQASDALAKTPWKYQSTKTIRFDEGAVAVHLQSGSRLWSGLLGGEQPGWFALDHDAPSGRQIARTPGSRREHHRHCTVTLRMTKEKSVRVRALLHREIPPDAKISWIRVHQVRVGPRHRWSLQIVAEHADSTPVTRGQGVAGVDLGFRRVDTGYRVAYAVGDDGERHECVVPFEVADRAIDRLGGQTSKCTDLRQIRDQNYDALKKLLRDHKPGAPTWYHTATLLIHTWRSPGRAVRLLGQWRTNRWSGDEAVFEALAAWRKQDDHLWAWEANNRAKMVRQIEGLYQRWSSDLAKRYAVIKIEDMSMASAREDFRLKSRSVHEADGTKSTHTIADQRAMLALAKLQKALKERGASFGASVGEVDKAGTSQRCTTCSVTTKADAAQILTCPVCGATEDRDVRAAVNIASAPVLRWLAGPLAEDKQVKLNKSRRTRKSAVLEQAGAE